MYAQLQNLFKTTVFALIMCLANGYMFAGTISRTDVPADKSFSNTLAMGVLSSAGNQGVSVNGNSVESGMTILSGAEIKTNETEAVINLNGLGEVRLSPNTTGKLVFGSNAVTITLSAGNAELMTSKETNGAVITPDGKTFSSNPVPSISVVGEAPEANSSIANPPPSDTRSLFGLELRQAIDFISYRGTIVEAINNSFFKIPGHHCGPNDDGDPHGNPHDNGDPHGDGNPHGNPHGSPQGNRHGDPNDDGDPHGDGHHVSGIKPCQEG